MARPRKPYRVVKKSYRNSSGRKVMESLYSIYFYDHLDVERRITGTSDKNSSEYLGKNIAAIVGYRRMNQPLPAELRDFIQNQPQKFYQKLAAWGIFDESIIASFAPILVGRRADKKRARKKVFQLEGGHVSEWCKSMKAANLTPEQVENNLRAVIKIIEECGLVLISDICADKVAVCLANLRAANRTVSTSNKYLGSMKKFTKWLLQNGRLHYDPLIHLRKLHEEYNPVRRALPDEDVKLLLSVTPNEPQRFGLTGYERMLIYKLALGTGGRANELYTLKRSDFLLTAESPVMKIRAANAKNRKPALQPLPEELASELKAYFQENYAEPSDPAFPRGWKKTAEMIRDDFAAAGIECIVDGLKVDFHALRHTFGTGLARAGVPPLIAMKLMRHSSINLTNKYYAHLTVEDKAAGLAKLPFFKTQVKTIPPSKKHVEKSSAHSSENSDKRDRKRANSIRQEAELPGIEKPATPSPARGYGIVDYGAGYPVFRLHVPSDAVFVMFSKGTF